MGWSGCSSTLTELASLSTEAVVTPLRVKLTEAFDFRLPTPSTLCLPFVCPEGTLKVYFTVPLASALRPVLIVLIVPEVTYQRSSITSPGRNPLKVTAIRVLDVPDVGASTRLGLIRIVFVANWPLVAPLLSTSCNPPGAAGIVMTTVPVP